MEGVLYCNDGDWVESCTALVENHNGVLEILHWSDFYQSVKQLRATHDKNDEMVPLSLALRLAQ